MTEPISRYPIVNGVIATYEDVPNGDNVPVVADVLKGDRLSAVDAVQSLPYDLELPLHRTAKLFVRSVVSQVRPATNLFKAFPTCTKSCSGQTPHPSQRKTLSSRTRFLTF